MENTIKSGLESNSPKQRNQKFKYLTTNMQNLLKNFNENLTPRKSDPMNKMELMKKLKVQQPSVHSARSLNVNRSKTIPNRVDIPRPVSQLDSYNYDYDNKFLKPKINRSQSQLNYSSLQRASSNYDNPVNENTDERIRKSKSSQQIQLNSSKSSFITDSYNTDTDSNPSSRSPSCDNKRDSMLKQRVPSNFIENPKSVVLRREKTLNDKDLPLMKQRLMASVKRGHSVLSENRDQVLLSRINELQNRIFVLELELDREKKKLSVEKEEKNELINEIKIRYENEKTSALKALEAKLNTDKLFEMNKIRELVDLERKDEYEQKKKFFENEIMNLKVKLREKNEKCSQLEKLLKDEHSKSEKLFIKSIEMVRKYGSKTYRENTTSSETQTDQIIQNTDENLTLKLNNIRQILVDENDLNHESKNSINDLLNDIEIRSNRLKQQFQTQSLDLKLLRENKLKMESLYKIKCKSDLNKSAKIKKLEINYQTELLKLRNEFNSDIVRYLENKVVTKEIILNDIVHKLNKFLNILNESNSDDMLRLKMENTKDLIQNLINSTLFDTSESNLNTGLNDVNININLDNIYKKAPINFVVRNDLNDFKSNSVIRKIDQNHNEMTMSFCSEKEKQNRSIHDEIMELDKHLIDMKLLSDSLIETKDKNIIKCKRSDYKSSSNSSSCDISNSSHSFIELEEASDLKFSDKPNINLVTNRNFKKKPTIELVI